MSVSVYIDTIYPLRNNQTDPNNPIYTGKIKAEDTIYITITKMAR